MAQRAALVTGASSGIGLAIARLLGEEGYAVTMSARRAEKLESAVRELAESGLDVHAAVGDVSSEEDIERVVAEHGERHDRLDVLVNNAGGGLGAPLSEITTKRLDVQLSINLRQIPLFYRAALPLLKRAASEHHNALVINTASIAGKRGEAWLSVYSAAKHGVVGWTEAMNRELAAQGIKSTVLCPAFVDTPMTEFVKGQVPAERMITVADVAESVRFLLRTSPACVVPEIMFELPSGELFGG